MTDPHPDIDAIRERRAAITPGEWRAEERVVADLHFGDLVHVCLDAGNRNLFAVVGMDMLDATFIAHGPADIDTLLAEVERLTKRLELAEAVCEAVPKAHAMDGNDGCVLCCRLAPTHRAVAVWRKAVEGE